MMRSTERVARLERIARLKDGAGSIAVAIDFDGDPAAAWARLYAEWPDAARARFRLLVSFV